MKVEAKKMVNDEFACGVASLIMIALVPFAILSAIVVGACANNDVGWLIWLGTMLTLVSVMGICAIISTPDTAGM